MKLTPAHRKLLQEAPTDIEPLPEGRRLHDRTLVTLEKHGLLTVFRKGHDSFWCLTAEGRAYRDVQK